MSMIEPNGGKAIPGIAMPDEVYWVLSTPAPLAGMKYPRQGFPWGELAKSGFVRLVALHPGRALSTEAPGPAPPAPAAIG